MDKRFDLDDDDECCGLIGGELTCGPSHEGLWDWEPGALVESGHKIRVLGTLDMGEFHTARKGTLMDGSFTTHGDQVDPVDRGTIEPFRGGPGNPGHEGSEIHDGFDGPSGPSGQIDPVRAGSRQYGGARGHGDRVSPAVRGTDPYGERSPGGQVNPARRGTKR